MIYGLLKHLHVENFPNAHNHFHPTKGKIPTAIPIVFLPPVTMALTNDGLHPTEGRSPSFLRLQASLSFLASIHRKSIVYSGDGTFSKRKEGKGCCGVIHPLGALTPSIS